MLAPDFRSPLAELLDEALTLLRDSKYQTSFLVGHFYALRLVLSYQVQRCIARGCPPLEEVDIRLDACPGLAETAIQFFVVFGSFISIEEPVAAKLLELADRAGARPEDVARARSIRAGLESSVGFNLDGGLHG